MNNLKINVQDKPYLEFYLSEKANEPLRGKQNVNRTERVEINEEIFYGHKIKVIDGTSWSHALYNPNREINKSTNTK